MRIRLRRGLKTNLPNLAEGEPGFCQDTGELFVGSPTGNRAIGVLPPANGVAYGTSTTAAGTAAKVSAITGFIRYTGAIVGIRFSTSNTAATPTLNVNSTGAAQIRYNGAAIIGTNLTAGDHLFQFDGSYWNWLNYPVMNQATQSEAEAGTGTAIRAWTPERVKQAVQSNAAPTFDGPIQGIPAITLGGGVGHGGFAVTTWLFPTLGTVKGIIFNGKMMRSGPTAIGGTQVADIGSKTWTSVPSLPTSGMTIIALFAYNGVAYAVGRTSSHIAAISFQIFSTTTGETWTALASHQFATNWQNNQYNMVMLGLNEQSGVAYFGVRASDSVAWGVRTYTIATNTWATPSWTIPSAFRPPRNTRDSTSFIGYGNNSTLWASGGTAIDLTNGTTSTTWQNKLGTQQLSFSGTKYIEPYSLGQGKLLVAIINYWTSSADVSDTPWSFIIYDTVTDTMYPIHSMDGTPYNFIPVGSGDGCIFTNAYVRRLI
ncbi:MAG: hypothetical protein FWG72_10630 [Oscillospiraceae bacterium]|nr:hypothetical protein [Oscillospiraceae bacterium]